MCLRIYECRRRWYWKLIDKNNCVIAKSLTGYRSFSLAKDYARYTKEGLANCLKWE